MKLVAVCLLNTLKDFHDTCTIVSLAHYSCGLNACEPHNMHSAHTLKALKSSLDDGVNNVLH